MSFNKIENLLTPQALEWYKNLPYPHNVQLLIEELNKQLKKEPDYEVFVPIKYIRMMPNSRKDLEDYYFEADKWLISNKGRVLSCVRYPNGKLVTPMYQDGNYLEVRYTYGLGGNNKIRMLVHRMVASAFIVPDRDVQPHYASVRFHDGDRDNIEMNNLYWYMFPAHMA